MGKDYDVYVTPQNTPRFRERKIIFAAAMGLQALNWLLLALVFADGRRGMILMALMTIGFTVVQWVDQRKAMWTWRYILSVCAIDLLVTAYFCFLLELSWLLAVMAAEVVACAGLAAALLRPKHGK